MTWEDNTIVDTPLMLIMQVSTDDDLIIHVCELIVDSNK
jgi:hypothetical protein